MSEDFVEYWKKMWESRSVEDKELAREWAQGQFDPPPPRFKDVWGNAAFLGAIYTETPKTSPSECTCDSKDLANFGCKCGWIERERELRKEKEDAN